MPLALLGILSPLLDIFLLLLVPLLWLLYFTYFETTTGQTIGKRLLRIQVVNESTRLPIDVDKALVRNTLRIVDVLPFFYLLGGMLVMSSEKKRLGDIGADSIVIKTR